MIDGNEDVLAAVEAAYREVKGRPRTIRENDLIRDDLDIDSLDAMTFLITLEERLGLSLVYEPAVWSARTAGELLAVLQAARPAT